MKNNRPTDWGNVYEAFDGTMPGCRGGACEKPCCNLKDIWTTKGDRRFRTVLQDAAEFAHLQKRVDLEGRGITVEVADIGSDRMQFAYLVNGCLDEDSGSCKLAGDKPFICRTYPFYVGDLHVDHRCPHVKEIATGSNVLVQIGEARTRMGMEDKETWRERILERL